MDIQTVITNDPFNGRPDGFRFQTRLADGRHAETQKFSLDFANRRPHVEHWRHAFTYACAAFNDGRPRSCPGTVLVDSPAMLRVQV